MKNIPKPLIIPPMPKVKKPKEKEQLKKMDGERAIKELKQMFADEMKSGDWLLVESEHICKACTTRTQAIIYAIESIRFRMAIESEERGKDNG